MELKSVGFQLRDGVRVHLRAPRPADRGALVGFLGSLSPESRRLRFFSAAVDLNQAARWAADADGVDRIGLLALDSQGQIVGYAACTRLYGPRGEVAVEVDKLHRHLGLTSLLLRQLAREAERQGIRRLVAEVLPESLDILSVFADDFDAAGQLVDGEGGQHFPERSLADAAGTVARPSVSP